jgi:hypothetical protein
MSLEQEQALECRWVCILAPGPLTAKLLCMYRGNKAIESLAAKVSGPSMIVVLCEYKVDSFSFLQQHLM